MKERKQDRRTESKNQKEDADSLPLQKRQFLCHSQLNRKSRSLSLFFASFDHTAAVFQSHLFTLACESVLLFSLLFLSFPLFPLIF